MSDNPNVLEHASNVLAVPAPISRSILIKNSLYFLNESRQTAARAFEGN